METKALFFVELAAGIVLGFVVWSFIAPSLVGTSTPTT